MKIGVSSYSFNSYIRKNKCDYIHICNKAKELGFDGIEFINLDNPGWDITNDPKKNAAEIKSHCDNIGLEIYAYTVGANFLSDDPEKEVKRICECLDVAKILGAPVLRHDVCWALPKKHLYSYRDAIKELAPYIRKVADYAESLGIKTCTENHGHIFQAPGRVEELILAVNHKNFGWLCDMGNFLCVDVNPIDAVKIAAPYAFHVHAKDFFIKDFGTRPEGWGTTRGRRYFCGSVLGEGVVPVKQCIDIVRATGYDGYFSLEYEGKIDCLEGIKRGYKYLREIDG